MKIGFTGTKIGMTDKQQVTVERMLHWLNMMSADNEFHHGACIGSDYLAGIAAHDRGFKVVLHPPINKSCMAACYADETRPARPYLVRNHDIVDETDILIATPKGFDEELRSGTWATIRYARKLNRQIFIIWPDGNPERGDR